MQAASPATLNQSAYHLGVVTKPTITRPSASKRGTSNPHPLSLMSTLLQIPILHPSPRPLSLPLSLTLPHPLPQLLLFHHPFSHLLSLHLSLPLPHQLPLQHLFPLPICSIIRFISHFCSASSPAYASASATLYSLPSRFFFHPNVCSPSLQFSLQFRVSLITNGLIPG